MIKLSWNSEGTTILVMLLMFTLAACSPQIVGNDKDSHGCIGSAGYSWCDAKQKCLRPFEESCGVCEKTFNVTQYKEVKTPHGEPRCEQMPYNFTRSYSYSEGVVNGIRQGTCVFNVRNDEDVAGTFRFYPNIMKNGKINDGPDQTKAIEAFKTETFTWPFELTNTETASCLLQCSDCPHRIKCFYLEPIIYDVKSVPYTVQEKRNVSC